MEFKQSPTYPMNLSFNQKGFSDLSHSSLLSDIHPRNASLLSPAYMSSKSNFLNSSSMLSSSLSYGYGGCDSLSNISCLSTSPAYKNPSPMYIKKNK